jgi:uncharacterized RDD family membrane protein YckC
MEHLTIETPEQIPLEFRLAGIGSRFVALAIDTLIQAVAVLALLVVAELLHWFNWVSKRGSIWVAAILWLAAFLIGFGYFVFFEAVWNGQTPGKRYHRLRVIKDSGRPISAYDAVTRNLLRLIDGLPGVYAVGILSMLFSSQNKRLGDYAAGTVVVHEAPFDAKAALGWSAAKGGGASQPASRYDARRLSPEEFQLIEAFLLRRTQLPDSVRARMARNIMDRIAPKLGVAREDQGGPERLLEALAAEYRDRNRFS